MGEVTSPDLMDPHFLFAIEGDLEQIFDPPEFFQVRYVSYMYKDIIESNTSVLSYEL